jgi:tetratricopeptide (TPR) repeat protein
VFSLGIILYQMATGLHPFAAGSFLGTLHAIIAEIPAPPSQSNPEIATSLDSLILSMLDKDAARRPSALVVEAALTGISVPAARPPLIPARLRRALYGMAVVVALLAAGGAFLWQRRPQAPPLTDKDVLVLADFTNSTGDPVFDGTLREALAVQLERSPFLKVMTDPQVRQILRLMGRAPGEQITNEVAREVCERGREKAMIGGSIAALGASYAIILHATNCATGETLAREQVQTNRKEEVLAAIGVAATRIRTKLGESLGSIQALERHSAMQASTPSLDAFHAYALGLAQFRLGLWLQSVPLFQRATELDPNFAMAFQVLGHAYANAGERTRAIEYTRKAFALIDRVSERERLSIAAMYHERVTGDADNMADAFHLFVQTYPRISIPRIFRGAFYYSMGEFEKAAQDFEEAVRLDPRGWIPYANLMGAYAALDQLDKASAVGEKAFTQKLDAPGLHQLVLRVALMRGDEAAAAKQIQWFAGNTDQYLSLDEQASGAIVLGQRRKAAELLKRTRDLARRRNLIDSANVLTDAAAADPFGDCQVEDELMNSLRACADLQVALTAAEATSRERPADTLQNAVHLPVRRAAIELKRNHPAKAIELLRAAAPYERRYPEVVYLRALAYLRTGKAAEAAGEFQKIIDHKGASWGPRYPLAYLGLARAAARAGDSSRARKAYQDFLTLWKDADPDIPALSEAKKEYAALNEPSRGRAEKSPQRPGVRMTFKPRVARSNAAANCSSG